MSIPTRLQAIERAALICGSSAIVVAGCWVGIQWGTWWAPLGSIVVVAGAAWGTARWKRGWERRIEAMQWRACPTCGHDLRGIGELGVCPECGKPFVMAEVVAKWTMAMGNRARGGRGA